MPDLTDLDANSSPTLATLSAAAEGLFVPSESDAPFTPFQWLNAQPLTPQNLLLHLGKPLDTPVETRTLADFFDPLTTLYDWFDDEQRTAAARFAALRDQFTALLTDPLVYRVGRIQITVIIAGHDATGRSIGLQTMLIETS